MTGTAAFADADRDAQALILAIADQDEEASNAIIDNGDPILIISALASFIISIATDYETLHKAIAAWRHNTADTEAGNP